MSLIDPASLPAGSAFSFMQPCLSWRLAAAFKTHWGYTGFDLAQNPDLQFPNRYLTKTVSYRVIVNSPFGNEDTTTISTFTVDRFSGVITADPPGAVDIENGFNPYPITYGGDTVQIADSGVVTTGSNTTERQIYTTTLSNPYLISQLESDVDNLLAAFDPATVPDKTLTELAYLAQGDNGTGNPSLGLGLIAAIDAMGDIPGGYPPFIQFGSPIPLNALGAAALAAYSPGIFGPFGTDVAPGMVKVIAFISMAGLYCLRTYIIDDFGNPVGTPTCVNGSGGCGSFFKVAPPSPYSLGQETYVVFTPNGQCGS
jgi:hypothetical protein